MRKKTRRSSGDIVRIVLVCICAMVFLGCGGILLKEFLWRNQSAGTYSAVAEDVWESPTENSSEETSQAETASEEEITPEVYNPPPGLADLMASNENVKGWIYIADTQINYPIMQHPTDNEYYLHRDLNGNKLYSGAIFLDVIHNLSENGIKLIYGHHMKQSWKAGIMFRELVNYRKPEYMLSHDDIVIWTGEKEYHYKPIYCYAGKADGTYRNKLRSVDELNEFFKGKIGIEPNSESVLVLVTCSYGQENERTYLVCVPR